MALLLLASLHLGWAPWPDSHPPPRYAGAPRPPPLPCAAGARRVSCAAARFAEAPRATPSSFILDGPYLGNGNFGAAMGATGGLTWFLGSNNLWSFQPRLVAR